MIFESKYDEGQQIFHIKEAFNLKTIECSHCKRTTYGSFFSVDHKMTITGISFRDGEFWYKLAYRKNGVSVQAFKENEMGTYYFLTKEEAQAMCDKLNKKEGKKFSKTSV